MKIIRSSTGFRSLITLGIAVYTGLRAERITSLISHHSTSAKNSVSVVNIINNLMMDWQDLVPIQLAIIPKLKYK